MPQPRSSSANTGAMPPCDAGSPEVTGPAITCTTTPSRRAAIRASSPRTSERSAARATSATRSPAAAASAHRPTRRRTSSPYSTATAPPKALTGGGRTPSTAQRIRCATAPSASATAPATPLAQAREARPSCTGASPSVLISNDTLQHVRRELGQVAPFTLREDDMGREPLPAEALGGDGQAVGRAVDVRIVDLPRVAREDDLRPVARPRDDRLHLVGREVLRLVDDDELLRERATGRR